MEGSLTSLGGFVFTAISSVIPPILNLLCFHDSLSMQAIALHVLVIVFCFIFMCVSTFFSAYQLILKMMK